jgi:hypothetical protein
MGYNKELGDGIFYQIFFSSVKKTQQYLVENKLIFHRITLQKKDRIFRTFIYVCFKSFKISLQMITDWNW